MTYVSSTSIFNESFKNQLIGLLGTLVTNFMILLLFLLFPLVGFGQLVVSDNIPEQYQTRIYLIQGPMLEGYLVFSSVDHLVLACTSCVDEGNIFPEVTIPSKRIKKIHQKVKDNFLEEGDKNQTGCIDPLNSNATCPDGCLNIGDSNPEACLIFAGFGLIVAAIVAIAYEHKQWDRYKIKGDVNEYKKIIFQLRVFQRPGKDALRDKIENTPGFLLHPNNL